MNNIKKKEVFPELRFLEFKDKAGWIESKLIDVTNKKIKWSFIGGPFGSNLKSSDYVEKGIRIIQLQNIGDAKFNEKYKIFTSKEKADELLSNNIYPGDIIISKMGDPVGRACLIPDTHDRYVMCSDGIRLVVDEKLHSKYFIYLLINDSRFRSIIEENSTGSTRKRIGLADLKNLPMCLPMRNEQQKIADCISSLDELLRAQNQKLEVLKAHKKGCIQQLFPSEGKKLPERRFPEFNDKWKVNEIGGLVSFISGYGFKSEYFSDTGKKLLIPKNFTKGGFANFTDKNTKFTTEEYESKYVCKSGDLLLLLTDLTPSCELLGRPLLLGENDGEVLLNQRIVKIIPSEKIELRFIQYFFSTNSYRKRIVDTATGSTVKHSSNKIIASTKIHVPSLFEQRKIADFISSVDDLIISQNIKIEALKNHKAGLMQQLFPDIDKEG